MSVSAPDLSKKIASTSIATASSEKEGPHGRFRKLLEVSSVGEHPHHSLFALIEEEEDETEELTEAAAFPPACGLTIRPAQETTSMTPSLFKGLSANMEALFEKMASHMMVMELTSETQTTLFLDQPQFEGSAFFGTKIIIKEFTAAPKTFNIEIISNPTAIGTIQKQQQSLLSVFAQGNFHFTVHRLDTQIEQDSNRPLLHRREEEDAGQQEQQKDQQS